VEAHDPPLTLAFRGIDVVTGTVAKFLAERIDA
jgi:hypothetical protein